MWVGYLKVIFRGQKGAFDLESIAYMQILTIVLVAISDERNGGGGGTSPLYCFSVKVDPRGNKRG